MQITFNPEVFLLAVIISASVFTAVMLCFLLKNKLSNRLLAILIIAIALWLTDNFMRVATIYNQKPNLYFLPLFYSFAFGPLIYFYVKSLTNYNFKLKVKHIIHFVPVILQMALYVFLTFTPYSFKNWYWENIHQQYTYKIEFDGTWLSLFIYLILSFKLLQNYQAWLINNFSETSRIRLNWLKIILVVLIILCVQWLIEVILRDFFRLYFQYNYSVEILGAIALVLGIAGWQQATLAEVNYNYEEQNTDRLEKNEHQIDESITAKIIEIMEIEKLYLNPTLSLVQFSKSLKIQPKIVSKHINIGLNKSFNYFVNEYRVNEVKQRLKSSDLKRITILGIAFESGFNSKTTFHRIFKEFTGIPPTEFIR